MEKFVNWFESLKNTKQVDEYLEVFFTAIVTIFKQIAQWFNSLSVNQKLVVTLVTIIMLYCINCVAVP